MKSWKIKMLCGVCGFTMTTGLLPVYAADSYTVTYRAGNIGTFDVAGWAQTLSQAGYDSSTTEITENYIKIKTAKGAAVPEFSQTQWEANTDIGEAQTYFMLAESDWGPSDGATVTRNQDYVVDYGVLVNPVRYEIDFVDAATGTAIAPPVISYGNEGEKISCTPIAVSDYATVAQPATLTLKKGAENQVLFSYNSTLVPETEERTVQQTQTITRTEPGQTIVLPNNNPNSNANNNANTPADNTANTIADNNVPLGNTPQADNAGNPNQDNVDQQDNTDGDQNLDANTDDADGVTNIDDNEVPRVNRLPQEEVKEETKQPEDGTVTIEDTEVPRAQEVKKNRVGTLPIIIIMTAALLAAGGVGFMIRRKKRLEKE